MAVARLDERFPAPSHPFQSTEYSLTDVSYVIHDLSWDSADGSQSGDDQNLENEVMVETWSSMDSTNSPSTDSGPSASEDGTPSTSSEPPHLPATINTNEAAKTKDKPRPKDLDLESRSRRHFLDEDYKTNIENKIKPHFLDHAPSPDDEKSDITNPNFLDEILDGDDDATKTGALPKKPQKPIDDRPKPSYRSAFHYGLEAARTTERNKRTSQLYQVAWPGDRDVWAGNDTASVRSYSSNGSAEGARPSSKLENKMECVYSLLSLLTLSPDNNADLSGSLLEMSRSVESCVAMRQAGCIPLLVQLIHSKLPRETRDRAAKALRNIIHTQTDDKAGRRESRVWRLLEQVREYCYSLEELIEAKKDGKEVVDDVTKHPSQSVAALMKLSFDEEHRHVVCQLGGLQALAALVSNDQAAHGSRTDDNTCLTMRKYAGMTLTNLTFGDGNNKSLLCSFKDFMTALVEQLESPNDDMRQVTAAVLRNLSWRADTNSKQVLREVGAVKGLTKAAMTCQKEATLKSVLSALWNLTAHCSMNKVALCSVDGALGFLVDMLSYDSPTKTLAIVENAGGIMRNVSSHIAIREDYRQILRERNCLSVLLQHLKSPSLTVVSNSCGTLWNLSARCPQDQQFLWDNGAVPMLRSLIHSKHKMIAMGSGAALKNLINSKPGKTQVVALDTTARNMNLPALPTLGVRKQKALEQELDNNLAETCDNIEPATSPTTSNREEKNIERQIALNLERHRMSSSSPMMGTLPSQISLSHSAHLANYLSCSNTLLKGALTSRSSNGSSNNVNRSDSKDSVTSAHSDTVFEKVMRSGKVPIPTPRSKDLMKNDLGNEAFKLPSKTKELVYPTHPPIPPPRSSTEMRTNYTESGYDVDQDSCDQPIDFSRKYSETKPEVSEPQTKKESVKKKKDNPNYGDYQETDLDQPTDYSLRYAEHHSETGSDLSEPQGPSVDEDTIKHFATEGTPYETPIIFSTATSMSDLRVIGKDGKPKNSNIKENPEVMTHSDEKDTCSIEDPPKHDNDKAVNQPQNKPLFDTKFSSGMISPEKPVNYCDEGTPGYFSRVSSLSSLGEPTEEDCIAKKNAMATINVELDTQEQNALAVKDKEGSKAVTFACDPVEASSITATPGIRTPAGLVEDTPLMFSRTSSLGSIPDCDQNEIGSVISEISRMTSGCMSESELPESPCGALSPLRPPLSAPPTAPLTTATSPTHLEAPSVFSERATTFLVENTPAHFSINTSLSDLTIDDEPKTTVDNVSEEGVIEQTREPPPLYDPNTTNESQDDRIRQPCDNVPETTPKDLASSERSGAEDSTDSSNLSDSADLLEECIQKGIDKVVKHKGPPSETDSVTQYVQRDGPYLSLPSYLRSSTETVKMSHEFSISMRNSPPPLPPPLPPRGAAPPPRPPPRDLSGAKHESRLPIKTLNYQQRDKPKLPTTSNLARNDSLSSLSIDSFGSTDREIFEETVKAGLSSVNPRRQEKHKANERQNDKNRQYHKSLDRSDKIIQNKTKSKDPDFERNLASGAYNLKTNLKIKRIESEFVGLGMSRAPFSYHGDTASSSLVHRSRAYNSRYNEDGPPSLPIKVEPPKLERSNSLSSLSNDSFGSTDKEVFERCVRIGMNRQIKRKDDARIRVRSDDRLEARDSHRSRRRKENRGALDKMVGEEYSKDRAILEEMIARGAGEKSGERPKNVTAPSVASAGAGGHAERAPNTSDTITGYNFSPDKTAGNNHSPDKTAGYNHSPDKTAGYNHSPDKTAGYNPSNQLTPDTTIHSNDLNEMDVSNEYLAHNSVIDSTLDSETKDELNRSNESYADVLNETLSDIGSPPKEYEAATLTRKKPQWTEIKIKEISDYDLTASKSTDTWNDNTCFDDVTLPTVSGSVHLISSILSEVTDPGSALPDLLEKSGLANTFSRPDLTSKLDALSTESTGNTDVNKLLFDSVTEPSLVSLSEGTEQLDSLLRTEIQKESARLAAQLRNDNMVNSVTSLSSLDLNNVKPPSNFGSLVSLDTSGHWEENKKPTAKNRKKSLPVAIMVKRALSNSYNQGSSEHLDHSPNSFILENVKPPLEMEHIDMESSIISVSSITSDIVEVRNKTPIVFDLKQPIQEFPMCNNLHVFHDLENVNPPSLFEELVESATETEQTTAQNMYEDCVSTLNVVTDIPSGSENCSPLPSDISSVESTPKKINAKCLTPKEKRIISKDRYQTYTITDNVSESDVTLQMDDDYLTWTKSESDSRSDDYVTAISESKSRKKSAKQRRIDDRARYQTQTVNIHNIVRQETSQEKVVDPEIESLKQRLAAKKTIKQKRIDDADRFRTRTLSEDIPPSPTYVSKDANFENVETTTGYDSLSSNELNHQQISEERHFDDTYPRDTDSGNNDDETESNTQMLTYTRSFKNHLPIVESPTAIDLCIVNNLKNIELTASYRRALQSDFRNPSSSDFASYEGDTNSDKAHSDSEPEAPIRTAKPKIIKPTTRDASLDSNESQENEAAKVIRGKKKALYVSPYRRNLTPKKPAVTKPLQKPVTSPIVSKSPSKANKTPLSRPTSLNSSPKKVASKLFQKPTTVIVPLTGAKPLPLERQGTFTKEESTVLKDIPKASTVTNTSPSRLPQYKNANRAGMKKTNSAENKVPQRPKQTISTSASNHSLQSNESNKTVTLASKNSRQGSASSINSASSKPNTRDVESKIANLWKKVEQNKKTPTKPDKRVWIGNDKELPKLIRSSTFEGQPKPVATTAPKQKTAIGMKVSQIPSLKAKTQKPTTQIPTTSSNLKRPANTRVFVRKQVNGQTTT